MTQRLFLSTLRAADLYSVEGLVSQSRPAEITPIAHLLRVTQLWWSQTQNIHLLEDSRGS